MRMNLCCPAWDSTYSWAIHIPFLSFIWSVIHCCTFLCLFVYLLHANIDLGDGRGSDNTNDAQVSWSLFSISLRVDYRACTLAAQFCSLIFCILPECEWVVRFRTASLAGGGGSCNLKADSYLYSRAKDINKSVKWESNMLHFVSFVVLLAEDYIFKK